MIFDDDRPRPAQNYQIGQILESLSVEEIEATIARLEEEIERLKRARDQKAGHIAAAAALFSRPGE
ncbi:MAG: DUF1192 domain-containing protein [Nitratireductor sp.]|nr:DUF1192 domain-containing protein [Nitratireductor sp.]MCB1454953.1 DUF1192 domain-containing protein [Nitratireductor sp.]MCB1460780.1 DUF1192 domain-containing protein [Nitratireductor sp.]